MRARLVRRNQRDHELGDAPLANLCALGAFDLANMLLAQAEGQPLEGILGASGSLERLCQIVGQLDRS